MTKRQYDAEILKHYDALQARAFGEPNAVTDELLGRYELLKAQVEKSARTTPGERNQPDPKTQPAKPAPKPGTHGDDNANRDRAKLPPQVDAVRATDDDAKRE